MITKYYFIIFLFFALACSPKQEQSREVIDPLPSWNESTVKSAIMDYVENVTLASSPSFIPKQDRIATFDNDGTLWAEQPLYFQFFFAIDRVKDLAPEHPEWKEQEPFKSILNDDMHGVMASGVEGILKIVMESHSSNTVDEFQSIVAEWAKTAKHPTLNRPYTDLVYQPMLELLEYLRANDFKTYIVSGGGVDFMRALVTEVYGLPTEQIIGSTIATEFDYNDGNPVIRRKPKLDFINDKEGKPMNIQKIIGKKPVFAGGNSDGDLAMLQWTASNSDKSFMLYVHHTDSVREWAYDRESHIGKLDKGLDQANNNSWTVINMQKDWKVIYPFELN